jgi:hypothetical protein
MNRFAIPIFAFFFGMLAVAINAAPAHAQATRTWVSGVGDDVNPCSRTAPCKTFAGAISKTAAGGEINCIDPGGFGTLTITKALAIVCDHVEAGVLASGSTGITINAGVNDDVFLSGLDFEGINSSLSGINYIAGRSLHVRKSIIRGFTTGITFGPSANTSSLDVSDVVIEKNSGNGILIQPTGSGIVSASIESSQILINGLAGLRSDGTGSSGGITVAVTNTVAAGNLGAGFTSYSQTGSAATKVTINKSSSVNNTTGLNVNGTAAVMRIGQSVVSGNATGVNISNGATLSSYGNNQIDDNASPGSSIPTIPLH